ncbi:MAG TPA: tetratricopeptide repeat protein [Gammaproteobacteria bacterium]|nr:tetratricopeptide repeat protein [Gammaproteobacteria bacterium]
MQNMKRLNLMCLSRNSHLLYIAAHMVVLVLALSGCATVGGGDDDGSVSTPKSDDAWKDVPKPYVDGLKAAQKGRSKQAIMLFKQSTEDYPSFGPAYTNLGLQQLRLKDRPAAQASLKKSIEITPNNPVSYHHLGIIARLNGDFDSAQTMYRKAIEQNSDYAIVYLNLGILLDLYLYELEPALEQYEKYQSLQTKKDATVSKWIIEIKRRIARNKKS